MPLYIDLHIDQNLTSDLVKKCHVADKEIQERYGVKYLQILLNEPQGYLFCLVEGPDKETCARVHREAHGNIACNILEITESDFSALLVGKQKNGHDFTLNHDGTLDTGTRVILSIGVIGPQQYYKDAHIIIQHAFKNYDGRQGTSLDNRLMAVFDSCTTAIHAGLTIKNKIFGVLPVEVRMGVSMGMPLEEMGNFFGDVQKSADYFSFVSEPGQMTLSSKVIQQYKGTIKSTDPVRIMTLADEKFLNQVMTSIEKVWDDNAMTITDFAHEIGMSKSQLARKLKLVSGLSPNDFLKEFRLRKAVALMENHSMNIAEITMATGFTNPSYFTKCFRKRFGKAPSDYLTAH